MEPIKVFVKRLHSFDLPLPSYQTDGSSGMDLYAAIEESIIIRPLERVIIPTGLAIELPKGFEAQIRPRSGLALKNGITILNSPGTIDEDYRGEIKIILINLGQEDFQVNRGDRIAQMVFSKVSRVELFEVSFLNDTNRNDGGFGHTGF
ncbi:MAG: dUTP diphosphatase [Proteobacteria bacterium]|nr:dUTP diphosphatase [Pseudomonadota bacterium]